MVTLSLTEAVRLAFLNGGDFTQGASGIVNISAPGGIDMLGVRLYVRSTALLLSSTTLAAALLVLTLLAVWRLANSRLGWVFRSLRQNEDLASSIGIDIARYRVIAFAFCCGMGGIAGAFFAAFQQNIYPASYTVTDSINFMLYCFLGGLDFVAGPIVGAFLLVLAFELLGALQQYQALLYGVLMIAVMLFLPNGILSLSPGQAAAPHRTAAAHPPRQAAAHRRARPDEPLLSVQNLTERFGGLVAVNDVSFDVEAGEILSVIGPNGAGKSTLFKLIAAVPAAQQRPGAVQGERISGLQPHAVARKGVVRTFQETTVFKEMTALENVVVAHHLRLHATIPGVYFAHPTARVTTSIASATAPPRS